MMKLLKVLIVIALMMFGYVDAHSQDGNDMSLTVEFVINSSEFVKNKNYDKFIEEFVPYINLHADEIDNILLVGSASPEGNRNNNVRLANLRAEKIYSYVNEYIPKRKIIVNNDYNLFLEKTGLDESDYKKLRATYIEVHLKSQKKDEPKLDTVYIEKVDTVYKEKETVNNYYKETVTGLHSKPIISIYNNLLEDLLIRPNIGIEVYFHKMSFFVEGSFSHRELFGKTYNIDLWNTGFRKYFNDDYDKVFVELYGNAGYFDTDLFTKIGKIGIIYGGGLGVGYVFNLCPHWKISPVVRIGLFERIYFVDYYRSEHGSINISFGNYSNGNINNEIGDQSGETTSRVVETDKIITKEFFENCNKAFYIGPTYVGVVLKRDFCIGKKK